MTDYYGKYQRVTGTARTTLTARVKTAYEAGASVRAIARTEGCSYGLVHCLLSEAGVTFRPRGGNHRAADTQPGSTD
ncbi:helix-turn-helix domain-containing protein [Streptomyces sp. NPDC057910]|uniref:helix-turn-helix domain-containing protein n=1 Tax=Streptomyces sp. NPDC057910 TaxID=3346278 RepID=UPI0036E17680